MHLLEYAWLLVPKALTGDMVSKSPDQTKLHFLIWKMEIITEPILKDRGKG